MAAGQGNSFKIKKFCYDLSDFDAVKSFTEQILKEYDPESGELGQLDCLVNNAAIFDDKGPNKSKDGKYELTFMVNVLAPFYITQKILTEMNSQPQRILITSSISHTDCDTHLSKLDYGNLQFEKGGWTPFDSYGLSKLLVIMLTRGFRLSGLAKSGTTLINMDPGTVNTKMLLAGWGACGIEVDQAKDTFKLATEDRFNDPDGIPKYYCSCQERQPTAQARDDKACLDLYQYLNNLII